MATRPAKTGGNTTYVAEVAAGQTTIKASEVDGDLNEIYSNISNVNVAAGAAIVYSKLNLTGTIVNADISSSAAIAGSKLAAGVSINGESIANVTTALGFTTVETTVVQLGGITTRGGKVLLFGTGGLAIAINGTTTGTVTLRVYRDAGVIATFVTPLQNINAALVNLPYSIPIWRDAPVAGTYVYKVTGQTSAAGVSILSNAASAGAWIAWEMS